MLPARRCAAPFRCPRAWDTVLGPVGTEATGLHGGAGSKLEAGGCAEPSRVGRRDVRMPPKSP